MSIAFVAVTLLNAAWPVIAGAELPGISSGLELASAAVRNADGRSGFRASAVETLRDLPGIKSIYYARMTAFIVAHQDRQGEAVTALVSDSYFKVLGVRVDGPGFSRFGPWQRNLPRECAISVVLQRELTGSSNISLLGKDIRISDETCRVVGIVDSRFEGMRPPMRVKLWLSWPSMIGLNVPEIAPDEFLDKEQRIEQLGFVHDGTASLPALEVAIANRLRQTSPETSLVRLLRGDGIEPGARHRMMSEIRLILLAVAVLLAVILTFAVSYALWFAESMRGSFAVRLALGATAPRLIQSAARAGFLQVCISLAAGICLSHIAWKWFLLKTNLGQDHFQLAESVPLSAMAIAGLVLMCVALCTWLCEINLWLRPDSRKLARGLQRFASNALIEAVTAGFIIAATLVACLLSAWILADFKALRAAPRGYEAAEVSVLAFSPERFTGYMSLPVRTRRGHSVDAVTGALSNWIGADRIAMSSAAPHRGFSSAQIVSSNRTKVSGFSVRVPHNPVSINYFNVFGIPFAEGTTFSASNAREVILSQSAARRVLGDPPWVGQELSLEADGSSPPRRVVGVTKDVAYDGRNSTRPEMHYTPLQNMELVQVIGIAGPVAVDLADADEVLSRMGITDRLDSPVRLRDLDAKDDQSSLIRAAALLAICVLAVLLGAVGLAEMLLVGANRRLPEFALRSALGANLRRLAWSLFRAQWPALLTGVALGSAVFAISAGHLVARGFRVAAPDSRTILWAVLALLVLLVGVTIPSLAKIRRIPTAMLLKQL